MHGMQPIEIQIAAVHDVAGTGFGHRPGTRRNVVPRAVGDVDRGFLHGHGPADTDGTE